MNEHETQKHLSTAAGGERWSEEVGDPAKEPDQRWQDMQMQHLLGNERFRLLILGVGLLALLMGLLLDLFAGTILPLFATMVVVYLGYRGLDTWLDTHEPPYF
jgi:hypothetical protein